MFRTLTAAATVAFAAQAADAATYQFTYDFASGVTLSATIEGDLQGDGNTVIVTSVSDAALGGAVIFDFPDLTKVDSARDVAFSQDIRTTRLSLDGSAESIDFAACNTDPCTASSIGFAVDTTSDITGFPIVGYNIGSGPVFEVFDAARYSLAEIAAVPVPATFPLLGGALLLVAAGRRRAA